MSMKPTWAVLVCAVLLALFTGAAAAQDSKNYGSLYDDATLRHWAERYRPGIMSNLEEVLLPRLDNAERQRLVGLRVELPLRAQSGHPLDFYAHPDGTVFLPAMSLKFLDDMTVAFAWLWKHGYSVETALDYVGRLKYGNEAHYGRWPAPHAALGIPDDALDDADVDSLSQKLFKSAVIFILLHEMGHVLHQHPGYQAGLARSDVRANEVQADAFALEVMRRLPAQPTGMFFVFQMMVYFGDNRGDHASDAEFQAALETATHPVTPDRMRAIARILRDRAADFAAEYATREDGVAAALYLAEQIDSVANLVADPDLQRLVAMSSRRATLAGLAPRRPGEMLGAGPAAVSAEAFSGTYDGILAGGGEEFAIRMVLQRDGDRVRGIYNFGAGMGQLDGRVEGNTASFIWRSGQDFGRARLTAGGGELSGTWGYADSDSDGGEWRFAVGAGN